MNKLEVLPDAEAVSQAAADQFIAASAESIEERGAFMVSLAGGSTPGGAYQRLAEAHLAPLINWRKVHLFWSDERGVPPDHPESNYRMARDSFIEKVPVPQANVHRIQTELDPDLAAAAYSEELKDVFGDEAVPRFDLILLGMGDDGHTASLFPGTGALNEAHRWVVPNYVEALKAWRVTLTPRVLNAARLIVFLVTGSRKSERLSQVLRGERDPQAMPAQLVEPRNGKLLWIVDQAAAAKL
jgi:6-phosphogluconolactonase